MISLVLQNIRDTARAMNIINSDTSFMCVFQNASTLLIQQKTAQCTPNAMLDSYQSYRSKRNC